MKIAIIGAGNAGGTFGQSWARAGHPIVYSVRDPKNAKHSAAVRAAGNATVATVADAAGNANVIVLAVAWGAVPRAARRCVRAYEESYVALTVCAIAPKIEAPGASNISIRTLSPRLRNGVRGSP